MPLLHVKCQTCDICKFPQLCYVKGHLPGLGTWENSEGKGGKSARSSIELTLTQENLTH